MAAGIDETMQLMYRARLILRVSRKPAVTAGLMCPPLTCAIIQTMVATLRPKHSEIWTTDALRAHEPQPTSTRNSVPINSANTAVQNFVVFTSSRLPVDIVANLRMFETKPWEFTRGLCRTFQRDTQQGNVVISYLIDRGSSLAT